MNEKNREDNVNTYFIIRLIILLIMTTALPRYLCIAVMLIGALLTIMGVSPTCARY